MDIFIWIAKQVLKLFTKTDVHFPRKADDVTLDKSRLYRYVKKPKTRLHVWFNSKIKGITNKALNKKWKQKIKPQAHSRRNKINYHNYLGEFENAENNKTKQMPAQVPKIPALLSSRFQAPKLKRIFSPFPKSDIKSEPRMIIKHWIKQMARTAAKTIESTLDTPRLVKIN